MTDAQIALIRALQDGLPLTKEPFDEIARRVGIPLDFVLNQIEEWKRDGTIRRFGAVLNHRRAGFEANAMVVWNVPEGKVDLFGSVVARISSVSHCYERPRFEGFNYNIYTMVHARAHNECLMIVKEISELTGVSDYRLLYTTAELKKTSPLYFTQNTSRTGEEQA
ncbi:MAG: siroheme decarboxylase subunit beta [Armatimonadota bacterium]